VDLIVNAGVVGCIAPCEPGVAGVYNAPGLEAGDISLPEADTAPQGGKVLHVHNPLFLCPLGEIGILNLEKVLPDGPRLTDIHQPSQQGPLSLHILGDWLVIAPFPQQIADQKQPPLCLSVGYLCMI
jgi:hypothetical protein